MVSMYTYSHQSRKRAGIEVEAMQTRSQTIAETLRNLILEGEYLPGERLEEVPLAVRMEVSRTPVRAALATLEKEGLLNYAPKRGYEVRDFSLAEIADMYRVRSLLEGHAAGLCAQGGLRPGDMAVLDECLSTGDKILARGSLSQADLPAYREMNHRFHERILTCSGSAATIQFVTQMRQIPLISDRIILWRDYAQILRSHDDHHRVTGAIRSGNVMRAQSVMHEHVFFMGEVVCRHLSDHGALAGARQQELGA